MIHLLRILAMCKACQVAECNYPLNTRKMWAVRLYLNIMLRYSGYAHMGALVESHDLDMKKGC